jgi:predicted nuclease of predicted toxin-antitoxin system
MKFLIDAQLPRRLALGLEKAGVEAKHTLDLPQQNRTQDNEILKLSIEEQWIVITKDADFVDSFWLKQEPYKLLLVSTGNIKNTDLERLFIKYFPKIVELFESCDFIEMTQSRLVIHQ